MCRDAHIPRRAGARWAHGQCGPLRAPALTRHSHVHVRQSNCRDVWSGGLFAGRQVERLQHLAAHEALYKGD